ncbi:MAG: ribonuclease P protein component [bacterium]
MDANGLQSQTRNNGFPRQLRLREDRLIRRALRYGKRHESAAFVCYRLSLGAGPSQVCFRIAKRIGNSPARNRLKRRLREFLRTHKELWPENSAIVIKARPGSAELSFAQIGAEIEALFADE